MALKFWNVDYAVGVPLQDKELGIFIRTIRDSIHYRRYILEEVEWK